ncbi:SMC5-SMC6 complex localization factor protein 2 isoform X2 [Pseudophryne corroboree]|uniref:SMC5-SMC6 complex localization factor protein 2 isoform X2 n=1 Tax=Pseudophryne corroboree TaxID=495146 RepID=UPI003081EDB5
MSLLSPRIVIKRLILPITSQTELEDKGGYKVNGTSVSNNAISTLMPSSSKLFIEHENGDSSLKRKLFSQNSSNCSDKKFSLSRARRCSPSTTAFKHYSSETTRPEYCQTGDGVIHQKAGKSLGFEVTSPLTLHAPESGHPFTFESQLTIPGEENKHVLMSSNCPFPVIESNLGAVLDTRILSPSLRFSTDLDSPCTPDSYDDDFKQPYKETHHRTDWDSIDSDESFKGFPLSSDDEDEETLKPLDKILQLATQPVPSTPQRDSDLSIVCLSQSPGCETLVIRNVQPVLQTPSPYINNLDRILREREESKRLDEMEKRLNEDIRRGLGMSNEDMDDVGKDGELTDEHRAFLNKFTVVTNAIPDHHPGEEIFHLSASGSLFNHCTLDLKHSAFSGGSSEDSVIFSCDPENQLMLAMEGYFAFGYRFKKCPEVLMRWMFQMVSIHPSYCVSLKILNTLIEITCNNLTFLKEKPWTPSLLDIATVFANMGISFKTLFPLTHIQPSFSANDLVSAVPGPVLAEQRPDRSEQTFHQIPKYQIAHVIKFLGFCATFDPNSFFDKEILALIVLLLKIHLEKEMKDLPVVDLHGLLENLLQNIKEWEKIMPELCIAVSKLSSHHHNFIKLLQLIPSSEMRGREVRRHASLMCISNILSGDCTDLPVNYASRMMKLCRFMSQMKPSALVKNMQCVPENGSKTSLDLDQEAYYLTFSLLHLVNDASSSDESPSFQRKYILKLCTELEKHVKSGIREDARFFYRTKVKDLIARLHGRWQEMLLYSRPDQGKLHDYWQPVCDRSLHSSQESLGSASQEDSCNVTETLRDQDLGNVLQSENAAV